VELRDGYGCFLHDLFGFFGCIIKGRRSPAKREVIRLNARTKDRMFCDNKHALLFKRLQAILK
jgi:hypothetical protein